jgi:OOP family OmpA-OmpF porin
VAFEPPVLSPFLIKITKSPDGGITAVGAAPTNFDRDKIFAALQGMAGDAPLAVELMLAVGAPEGWTARVMQQVASIAMLREGVLTIKDDAVLMSGVAESAVAGGIQVDLPDVPGVAADTAPVLAEVARLEARDPSRLDVSIDASKGVMIQGLLPVGIEPAEARALLGVQTVTGRLETGGGGDPALWRAELAALGELLPEFENLDASLDTGVAKVSGEILPKSDVGQVEHLLQEGLANRSAAVDVSVSEQRFEAGDKRVNPVTNRPEIYKNGFWLPVVTLDGTEACHKASDLVLFTNKIRFLFDSAVLDVRARKVINALSSIALDCLKAADRGLAGAEIGGLEIGGHADSTGPAGYNRQLSGIRARAVRAALVERGAPATLLKVVAYGESAPIASNATTAGRAANRRISFDWLP